MKTRRILALVLALTMVFALFGCGNNTPSTTAAPTTTKAPETKAPESQAPGTTADAKAAVDEFLAKGLEKPLTWSVATGTGTGKQYVFMSSIGGVVNEKINNLTWNMESSNGGVDNVNQMKEGTFDMGFVQQDTAYEAVNGVGDFDEAYPDLRAVFPCYTQQFFIATTSEKLGNNEIKDIHEMDGMVCGTGKVTGSVWISVLKLQEVFDMSKIEFRELTTGDTFSQMAEGRVDMSMGVQGQPNTNITEYATNAANPPLYHPWLSDALIDQILEKYPFYSKDVIAKETYKSLTADYPTYGCWAFVFCDKKQDDLACYLICKALFENTQDLAVTLDSFKTLKPEQITNCVLPLKTGAIWFYEEQGVQIPKELYPEEYISLEDYVASLGK
ncbi:MAG: TAXI family TRAP transporter solute-binding subunit [Lachnospiraceae bacterium]|nr:TAXI family TRAP transporter solute-binding subunit [Lachnospiraceae bacterium]